MQYIEGNDRDQLFMLSLGDAVAQEAFVRVVDVFVAAIRPPAQIQNHRRLPEDH